MILIIHIICSVLSLGFHAGWLATALQQKTAPAWLRNSTLGTLGAAVASGLLLNDGTAHSLVHIGSMLGLFMMLHAALFAARRVFAAERR
jgi:uncharacterized membrane protein YeaQ/YmgE (transglycosylase-associated protein family)